MPQRGQLLNETKKREKRTMKGISRSCIPLIVANTLHTVSLMIYGVLETLGQIWYHNVNKASVLTWKQ